jgi:hypothetical protein
MSKLEECNQRMTFMKIEFDLVERNNQDSKTNVSAFTLEKVRGFIAEYETMNRKIGGLKQISDSARAKFWSNHFDLVEDMKKFVFRRTVDSQL